MQNETETINQTKTEKKKNRPLSRSITIVCAVFFILLCAILAVVIYNVYTNSMYERYQKQMESIVTYVESQIDHDDMSECAKTYEESPTYKKTQEFMDHFVDYYSDLHYLYILQALDDSQPVRIREICAGNSTYEKENSPDLVLHLGDGEEEWYDEEMEETFWQIQNGDTDVYLLEPSMWGVDYTLARPLINSKGEHYGILCVDVSVDELNAVVYRNIYIIIAVIFGLGIVFTILLVAWMHLNVAKPLKEVEESVVKFADDSVGKTNPEDLVYHAPEIRSRNEVRAVSDAVTKLSENMQGYLKDMVAAEDVSKGLQTQVFQDPLTKVKSKAAYDKKVEELEQAIQDGNAEFAIVMVDLNYLKEINDVHGHEHGNDYLIGTCRLICDVFAHAPVYRIGGDEFVIIVEGDSYERRAKLCVELRGRIQECIRNEAHLDPWNVYSAAVGMSAYKENDTVDDVFERADQAMYLEKARMKH